MKPKKKKSTPRQQAVGGRMTDEKKKKIRRNKATESSREFWNLVDANVQEVSGWSERDKKALELSASERNRGRIMKPKKKKSTQRDDLRDKVEMYKEALEYERNHRVGCETRLRIRSGELMQATGERNDLRAKVKRLRAALRDIEIIECGCSGLGHLPRCIHGKALAVARAALKETE